MRLSPYWLWAALVLAVAVAYAALSSLEPPEPVPAEAAGSGFSAERAWPLLERLVGDVGRHPVGTPAHEEVRQRIVAELETLGYSVEQQSTFVCSDIYPECGFVTNLMTRLPGQAGEEAVLVTAHYDSAGAGPGVSDDMVGVAVIIETARLLEGEELRNPVIFLLSDGEESGLLGAQAFLDHPWSDEVGVVVNVEARGTDGQSLLFETSPGNARLISEYAENVPRPVTNSLLYELYRLLPNDTDLSVYLNAGMPGVNFAFAEEVAHYHTSLDDLEHLNMASFQHQGDNVLGAVRAYAQMDLDDAVSGEAVYTDLFPGVVVQWPKGWTLPITIALILFWVGIGLYLVRRRLATHWHLVVSLLATVLIPMLAASLGWAVTSGILLVSTAQQPWQAFPVATRIALWSAAGFAVLILPLLLVRVEGIWAWMVGVWLFWSGLAAATAYLLPGASFLFAVPALVATIAALLVVLLNGLGSAGAVGSVSLVSFVASGWLWFAVARSVESGLGLELGAAIAACIAFALLPVVPLIGRGTLQPSRVLAVLTPIVTVGAAVVALLLPAYSERRPQRLSIVHMQAGDTAQWLLDGDWSSARAASGEVPPDLFGAAGFDTADRAWRDGIYLVSDAATVDVPPPVIELLGMEEVEDGRVVRVRLTSPREGAWLSLYSKSNSFLTHIDIPGYGESVVPAWSGDGYARFTCHGRRCSGIEAALHYVGTDPVELVLEDLVFRLPGIGEELLAARPETAVPSWDGDVSILVSRLEVE